jgi:hypothetical protein
LRLKSAHIPDNLNGNILISFQIIKINKNSLLPLSDCS